MITRRNFITSSAIGGISLTVSSGALALQTDSSSRDLWIIEQDIFDREAIQIDGLSFGRGRDLYSFSGDYLALVDKVRAYFENGGRGVKAAVGHGGINVLRACFKSDPDITLFEEELKLATHMETRLTKNRAPTAIPLISLESAARRIEG